MTPRGCSGVLRPARREGRGKREKCKGTKGVSLQREPRRLRPGRHEAERGRTQRTHTQNPFAAIPPSPVGVFARDFERPFLWWLEPPRRGERLGRDVDRSIEVVFFQPWGSNRMALAGLVGWVGRWAVAALTDETQKDEDLWPRIDRAARASERQEQQRRTHHDKTHQGQEASIEGGPERSLGGRGSGVGGV